MPLTMVEGTPPRGRPSATPTASNASPQGHTLWGRCWVPTPAPTAPGTHGSRNPGCPLQRTGGRGRDSAEGHQTPLTTVAGQPPRGRPPTTPAARSPHRACRPRGQCWAPTPTHPRPRHVGGGPRQPTQGRAVGGETAPDLRRPSQWWKASPPGTPFRHPHSEQRRPARAHAVGPVLGPHARTDRTRNTRVAEPWLPAQEDGRPGEGQRLTPEAPHNGGRPSPPGTPFRHPHSEQRRPARAHAVGPVLGPHTRTYRTRDTRVAEPWLPAPEDGRPGEGQRLTPDAPHNGGRPPPPGDGPPPPPRHAAPTGHASQGDSVGPLQPHTRAHSTWVADPDSPPSGRAVGGGTAPDLRRPPQWWKAPPQGRPSATPTASNAGPQGRTLWGRCLVPTPAPTAPGTHGSRNPGCPLQRTGGRGRDSA